MNDNSDGKSGLNVGLGPLPAPVEVARSKTDETLCITYAYTSAQIEAERSRCYAIAIAAERERCAKVCRDKEEEWRRRADAGEMQRDIARHAGIAAGQIEAKILRA